MINLKDQALKRDQLANELDFRCQNLEEQNGMLNARNQHLILEIQGLKDQHAHLITELRNQLEVSNATLLKERDQHAAFVRQQE